MGETWWQQFYLPSLESTDQISTFVQFTLLS